MARVFVTGSTDGIGRATASGLLDGGHEVVAHARNGDRRAALRDLVEAGAQVVVGDVSDLDGMRSVAAQANRVGVCDAVIHNAGTMHGAAILPVNVVAPYVLTCLMHRPERLVYVSSSMHRGGRAVLHGVDWAGARETRSYSDSKLLVTMLMAAVARTWPDVAVHAVDPGWVPTRMGGPDATDDLALAHTTQTWLATAARDDVFPSGRYWFHGQPQDPAPEVHDEAAQRALLHALAAHTGLTLDRGAGR